MTKADLKNVVGICILYDYDILSHPDIYRSKDEDKEVRIVRDTMNGNRFRTIKQNIRAVSRLVPSVAGSFPESGKKTGPQLMGHFHGPI